jgi:hypothetical protein
MASMTDLKQRGRSWLIAGALIVVGVLAGQVVPRATATPTSEKGTLTSISSDGGGTDIVFSYQGNKHTFALQDRTPWQDKPGVWHQSGVPSCLTPNSPTPHLITLGVINVQATGTLAGRSLVVWVKCAG